MNKTIVKNTIMGPILNLFIADKPCPYYNLSAQLLVIVFVVLLPTPPSSTSLFGCLWFGEPRAKLVLISLSHVGLLVFLA